MQYGPPPFLLNDNELLPFEHACMLREEHYSHPENLDSWESIMPTLWRFEVRWSIFGLSPLRVYGCQNEGVFIKATKSFKKAVLNRKLHKTPKN